MLGMGEEHKLSDIIVNMLVPDYKMGNYAFGYIDKSDGSLIKRVEDFNNELLKNDIHPAKPAGTKYKCPVDGCEYND